MNIYESLMIYLLPSDAEVITLADITCRYIHCCYTVAELYLFSAIPKAFAEIFRKCLNY